MAKRGKKLADDVVAHDLEGVQVGLIADEDTYDRRTPWRLASWGVGAVGAVTIAVLANQAYVHKRQDRVAAADLTRQSEQIKTIARESRNDIRRLSAAIDTLNSDRDRLYARATALEQGLESVTGSIARQNAAFSPLAASIPPLAVPDLKTAAPKTTTPLSGIGATAQPQPVPPPQSGGNEPPAAATATPMAQAVETTQVQRTTEASDASSSADRSKPLEAKSETANPAPDVTASIRAEPAPAVEVAVPRTRFGVDLGTARSIDGLRALWRRVTAAHPSILADLRPVIGLKERRGTAGVELRLVAGPLDDAARAAEVCAAVTASRHSCATTTFEGQQLAMDAEPAATPHHPPHRRSKAHHATHEKPATVQPPRPSPAPPPPPQR
ncbi:MAG: hypothetical protein J0H25_14460 [Rhizobiales bacterium]|nr:hypothetical protein [Hyphomicrobiales bacterium]